jgi:hypothetical protein
VCSVAAMMTIMDMRCCADSDVGTALEKMLGLFLIS